MSKNRRDFRQPLYNSPVYLDLQDRFVEHLRRLRKERSWTQVETAEVLGMKYQQYQQLESGKTNATMVTIARIAEAFQIDVIELFAPVRR